jgi:predicted Zn-dependent peptidase
MLGYFAAEVNSQDYPILKLLNTYLGNGLSSRLFVELREKRGLAYDVSCFYPTRLDPSQFVVYMGTAPQNTEIGIKGLEKEVKRLCEQPLSSEELQAAKNKLLGQYALGKQTNAEFAQIYGWYESLGLGIEFDQQFQNQIMHITPEIAQKVACNYFDDYFLSVVGESIDYQLNS